LPIHISEWMNALQKPSHTLNGTVVLDIVLHYFAPGDVAEAVDRLFQEPNWEMRDLYKAIIEALEQIEGRVADSPRTPEMIAIEISREDRFRSISLEAVEKAISELAHASQGVLLYRGRTILINGSLAEIERRLDRLTGHAGEPRKTSTFRNDFTPPGSNV